MAHVRAHGDVQAARLLLDQVHFPVEGLSVDKILDILYEIQMRQLFRKLFNV